MPEALSNDELALITRHGSGDLAKALALVQLADRRGRRDELRDILSEG